MTSTSNIEASPVEKRHEVPNVTDPLDMAEESFQRTTTNDLDMNSQSVKNDPRRFHASQQDSEMMVASNECKSAQKGEIFCGSDQDNEVSQIKAQFFVCNISLMLDTVSDSVSKYYSWVSLYHYPVILNGGQPELY